MVASIVLRVALLLAVAFSDAFVINCKAPFRSQATATRLAEATGAVAGDEVSVFLAENYPEAKGLLDSNDEVREVVLV